MFALVRFTDGSQSVVPMKKVKVRDKTTCVVKYCGANYEAQLLASNETREKLLNIGDTPKKINKRKSSADVKRGQLRHKKPKTIDVQRFPSSSIAAGVPSETVRKDPKVTENSPLDETPRWNEHTEDKNTATTAEATYIHGKVTADFKQEPLRHKKPKTTDVERFPSSFIAAGVESGTVTKDLIQTENSSLDETTSSNEHADDENTETTAEATYIEEKLAADLEQEQLPYRKLKTIDVKRLPSSSTAAEVESETVEKAVIERENSTWDETTSTIQHTDDEYIATTFELTGVEKKLARNAEQKQLSYEKPKIIDMKTFFPIKTVMTKGNSPLIKPQIADLTHTIIAGTDESTSTVDTGNETDVLTSTSSQKSNDSIMARLETFNKENNIIIFDGTVDCSNIHDMVHANSINFEGLPLEQVDQEILAMNSSQYMFDSLVHNPNTLFSGMELLTSTPETLHRDENANNTKNDNTALKMRTESAYSAACEDQDSDDTNPDNDPEYQPQDQDMSDSASHEESHVDQFEDQSRTSHSGNSSKYDTNAFNVSTAKTLPGSDRCNDEDLFVEKSRGRNGDMKHNFCFYCHTKHKKLARHLEDKHGDEPDVKKFVALPKKTLERRKIIGVIRKKGNFLFNSQTEYNDGELIVSRRPCDRFDRTARDFRACANCKAFFSIKSLRMHFAKCTGRSSKKNRIVTVMSKQVMARMHSRATKTVKERIFPPLREDDTVRAIRYDELVIVYVNKMGEKYSEDRDYEMVRQRVRLLGRFLITVRKLDEGITDMASVFDPKYCDAAVLAITVEAKLTPGCRKQPTPAVATSLGTLLKLLGSILINECIKKHDDAKKKFTKDFLKLLTQELTLSVNRRVAEMQTRQKRQTIIQLPPMADVKKLCTYLDAKRSAAFEKLSDNFSKQAWQELVETTLTSVQLFNRRRAGELQRTLIEDFRNYQSLGANADQGLFNALSAESQAVAKKYVRFVIRGKLNRTVPVLLSTELLECVELFLKYRKDMKISTKNPYLFGKPAARDESKYFKACDLIRKFSVDCGATHPERLRGTQLRKHIATVCVNLNLSEHQVTDLANYMGHAEKIHKDIYRQPLVNREILGMSKLLEAAQGAIDDEDTDDEDDPSLESDNDEQVGCDQENDSAVSFGTSSVGTSKAENVSEISKMSNNKKLQTSVTRKRFSSPSGVTRHRWNEAEKEKVLELFGEGLKTKNLPSLEEIRQAITDNRCLKNRTAPQIKTWLHNQTRSNIKKKRAKD